jgi:UDP-N-acetylmuramyl tripeptide synthase
VLAAGPTDVVVVAGRGPETEQIVGSARLPLDDAQEARDALALRERSGASSPSSSTSSR